jgi:2-keto-4-pentenoate hydratase/2-oxohepta-3-ene-1,7-dioic acid hydratase in catechol pathway
MGIYVVRFKEKGNIKWGVVKDEKVYSVSGSYDSLADFLKNGVTEAKSIVVKEKEGLSLDEVKLLSPITRPVRIVCQGANYSSHRAETGLNVKRPPYNLIFTKADSSLAGPRDDIIRPSHVELLDYEVEVGLVIRTEITEQVEVTNENIHEYVAGIVIANDITARDIQFSHLQWYKGKSYRTFCPTGPYLYLLEKDEFSIIHNLDVKLSVNGEVRQSANTSQLLYKPEETLTELSGLMNLSPGDLLLTGTPGGVGMKMSFEELNILQNPHADSEMKKEIIKKQKNLPSYLKDGDVVRCEMKTPDGKVNLGVLENKVIPSPIKSLTY